VLAGQGQSETLADFTRVLDLLVANYRVVRPSGRDRTVAGRPAQAVEAWRPDGTLAARFWIDRADGLLLRRDLVGRGGNTTTSTWFGELTVGPATVTHPPPLAADAWSHLLDAPARASWRAAGCTCAESLPDGMTLLQARTDDAGAAAGPGHGVVHLLYSDGLTEMSIFDQPGQLAASAPDELSRKGFLPVSYAGVPVLERITPAKRGMTPLATGEWVWECGGSVLTLVAPATPRSTADDRAGHVVAALAQRPSAAAAPADGPVAWVRRGWDRVVTAARQSWEHLTAPSGPSQDGALQWSHGAATTA
jgi:sigma-E factor negative regulatory protein RseB